MPRLISENSLTEFNRMLPDRYEQESPLLPGISLVLCANPSLLTLLGTNTWIIRTSQGCKPLTLIIDPGPYDYRHIDTLAQSLRHDERIIILVTHAHDDHMGAALPLAMKIGAVINTGDFMPPELFTKDPVQQQRWCQTVMVPDEKYLFDAGTFTPIATPGHTNDSLSFVLQPYGSEGEENYYPDVIFSGDTLLGSGSTVLLAEQAIQQYFRSLDKIMQYGEQVVLAPGHGIVHQCAKTVASQQYNYRKQRIQQLQECIASLKKTLTNVEPEELVPLLYADKDPRVWPAAQVSIAAQLEYLR